MRLGVAGRERCWSERATPITTRYVVHLTPQQRAQLQGIVRASPPASRRATRARILLLADTGTTDRAIAAALGIGDATPLRIRKKFVQGGLATALAGRPRARRRKLDAAQEQALLTLAAGAPPAPRRRWTAQLLANRLMALGIVDTISDETIRRILKQHGLRLR